MFVGIVLLVWGVVALLSSLGIVDGATLASLWPLILIAFGLWMIVGRLRGRRRGIFIDW